MNNFHLVTGAYLRLDAKYRHVIKDITRRMGEGMREFLDKDVISVDDYDKYCYYVAGLVGVGLTDLFEASGLEGWRLCFPLRLIV
jgi:farnesyl-diphosphate farnesyltransferase